MHTLNDSVWGQLYLGFLDITLFLVLIVVRFGKHRAFPETSVLFSYRTRSFCGRRNNMSYATSSAMYITA